MRNTGKGFVNVSASAGPSFTAPVVGRGSAFGDLNNDGQIDAVVSTLDGPPVVLRNDGSRNHWIGITLVGSKSNRQGIGARVTVIDNKDRKQIFDVSTAGSYLSSNDPRVIAGLGEAGQVKTIEVRWPSGAIQTISNPDVNRYLTISEKDVR